MPVIGYEHTNRVSVHHKSFNATEDVVVSPKLKALLDVLMVERPLWEFQFANRDYTGKANGFCITQDGEELGHVDWRYTLGEFRYFICNKRISDAMQRGRGYATKDEKKALLKIKKMFSQATLSEKIDKADEEIRNTMRNSVNQHERELYRAREAIKEAALRFVFGTGWPIVLAHLEANDQMAFNTVAKRDQLQGEVDSIKKINEGYISGNSTLVLRNGSVYIVKSKNGTHVHTDATLPAYIPPKLGMLKLVENEHYVEGIGIRVDENTFVVDGYERTDEQLQGVADHSMLPSHA